MREVSISIRTTGCKVNQADSAFIVEALQGLPVRVVPPGEPSDLAVVNACTVTGSADRDGRACVYRALRSTQGTVFLTGCLAMRLRAWASLDEDRLRVIPETRNRDALIAALRADILGLAANGPSDTGENSTPHPAPRPARPLVKVQDGCDHSCAFCIVPHVRGPSRSVPMTEVLARVQNEVARGASEVVLTGVDLGAWGRDLDPQRTLADLLQAVLDLETGLRFRLSSIEPDRLDDRLMDLLAGHPDLCPHLHVPVQSGSDRILRAMRRPHTAAEVTARLATVAARIPDLTLGLDVLCGFPGEDDDDFEATLALARTLPVTYLHVFPFSPRPGTEAATMGPTPARSVVVRRCAVLRDFSTSRREVRALAKVGRVIEVVDIRRLPSGGVESLSSDYFKTIRQAASDPVPGRHRVQVVGNRGTTLLAVPPDPEGDGPDGR